MILGKLIPAGTGMKRYRSTRLSTDARLRKAAKADEAAKAESDSAAEPAEAMTEITSTEVVNSGIEE